MFKELFELVRASGPLTMAVSADAPRGTMTVVVIPKPADAKDEPARQWYQSWDFEPSPTDPYHLFLMLKDLNGMLS